MDPTWNKGKVRHAASDIQSLRNHNAHTGLPGHVRTVQARGWDERAAGKLTWVDDVRPDSGPTR